jgi:hypothetical protein
MRSIRKTLLTVGTALMAAGLTACAHAEQVKPAVSIGRDGRLQYAAEKIHDSALEALIKDAHVAAEEKPHDRVPDFSHAGFGGGGVFIPLVPTKVVVEPTAGDEGARIQAAIDYVSGLAPDAHGIRGAVFLAKGRHQVSGQLAIRAGGVVLRGEGQGSDGTVLVATGTDRRALIAVRGSRDGKVTGDAIAVAQSYVSVGAISLRLQSAQGLKAGDTVLVTRPGTAEWVKALGMDVSPGRQQFSWKAEAMALTWERRIVAIDGDRITLDAPLTTALDARFGGGTVAAFAWPGRPLKVGVESLRCESVFDASNPLDEEHAWGAVEMDFVRDGWICGITGVHFAGSVVNIGPASSRITVQDCASLAPVSELGGYRRHTFHTAGQQTLFLRCRAEDGRHDFTAGYLAAGPNVFVRCTAEQAHGFSGAIGSWASGLLFDNVTIDGGGLSLDNLKTWNQGVGWAAANSMLWQCSAPTVTCLQPPTARNWADGVWGQFVGDGWWSRVNEFVRPDSLYETQLSERLGAAALKALATRSPEAAPASAPLLEKAVTDLAARLAPKSAPEHPLSLSSGWLVSNGRLMVGGIKDPGTWWRGYLLPGREATDAFLTRFAPGLTGPIHTDDLEELTESLIASRFAAMRHHYGLWYDRRRMDHERMRRPDGDVWPPFFEQPFARSGQGTAWDGLSRYDLTRYNPWFFGRLHQFAALGLQKGLVLINEMYFQHNIIEAGAHWVDFPWRPANCLQPTGFTEPPPFTGDTVKMAAEFYDLSKPLRRELHRAFIRHELEALADQPNVIHTISAEYSGPLHFLQFWLDVVAEWEKETGKHPLIALSATKDVQDAILADPVRSKIVDVIDLKYWWYTDDSVYAPAGGTDMAPRQHERLWRGGKPSPASMARMVHEYRAKYPEKAVISDLPGSEGWGYVAAGGSFPQLPATTAPALLAALPRLRPVAGSGTAADVRQWALSEPGAGYFAVALGDGSVTLDLRDATGTFRVQRLDPTTGLVAAGDETVTAGRVVTVDAPSGKPTVVWLTR